MQRKAVGKKTRFEVFKRDSFTCQYCGSKAPDVILEVDHIQPVSKGGKNTLLNYITSCKGCNSGKSDRLLSDKTVLEKQRNQLSDLQYRREQIEMMLEWQQMLCNLNDFQIEKICEYYFKVLEQKLILSDYGKKWLTSRIKKHGFEKLINVIDVLGEKYFTLDIKEQLDKVDGILYCMNASEQERNMMYVNGICRNRFPTYNPNLGKGLIRQALAIGYSFETLKGIASEAYHCTDWRNKMEAMIKA